MELVDIKLEGVKDLVPSILNKKFESMQIQNLQEIMKIEPSNFAKTPGVGKKVVGLLESLQSQILCSKGNFEEAYLVNTKHHILPIDYEMVEGENLLELINDTITDYINLFPKEVSKGIINHYYGLSGVVRYNLEEIGIYYNLTRERIRQLRIELIDRIGKLLEGNKDEELKCTCDVSVSSFFNNLKSFLNEKRAFTIEELTLWLEEDFDCTKIEDFGSTIDLILDAFKFSRCGKVIVLPICRTTG